MARSDVIESIRMVFNEALPKVSGLYLYAEVSWRTRPSRIIDCQLLHYADPSTPLRVRLLSIVHY